MKRDPDRIEACIIEGACLARTCDLQINQTTAQWELTCDNVQNCSNGYDSLSRLCSKCEEYYFTDSDGFCINCGSQFTIWYTVVVIGVMGIVLLLFQNFPLVLIIIEAIAIVILMIFNYEAGIVIGLVLILIVVCCSSQNLTSGALITSFVFYLQSTELIVGKMELPHVLRYIVNRLQFVTNLKLDGLECVFNFFREPEYQVLSLVLFPLGLCCIIILGVFAGEVLTILFRRTITKWNERRLNYRLYGSTSINSTLAVSRSFPSNSMSEIQPFFMKKDIDKDNNVNNNPVATTNNNSSNNNNNSINNSSTKGLDSIEEGFIYLVDDEFMPTRITATEDLIIRILRTILFFFFYSQFYVVATVMSLFRCEDDYMVAYRYIPCTSLVDFTSSSSSSYSVIFYTALAGFIFYGLILSLLWIGLIYMNWHGIKSNSTKLNRWFGFFHSDYKDQYKWWNILVLIRRLLLACFIGLLHKNDPFQIVSFCIVLLANLILSMHFKPAQDPKDNYAEVMGVSTLLLTYISSLQQWEQPIAKVVMQTLIVIINAIVIITFVVLVVRTQLIPIKTRVKRIWNR